MALYNNIDTLPEEVQNLLLDELLHTEVQGVNVTDGDANVLYINDAHYFITGHVKSQYFYPDGRGRNMQDLIDNRVVSNSASLLAIKSGKPVDIRQTSSAGKTFSIHAVPIRNAEGKIVLVLNLLSDLTEYVRMQKQVNEISHSKKTAKLVDMIDYQSQGMRETIEKAEIVADTDANVLISGPSGSAKPDLAMFMHEKSKRIQKPFVSLNCSAMPADLMEAELFGYAPGAFSTGQLDGKAGLMEQAAEGTLFLDAIGDMPKKVQARLLSVLHDREFTRIGGESIIPVNFRLIAATNLDLRRECEQGRFLLDLYYDLSVIDLKIPALRDCKEDIPLLAEHFLTKYNQQYNRHKSLDFEAMRILTRHEWKGNRRELRNVMERLVIQGANQNISGKDVMDAIGVMDTDAVSAAVSGIDIMPGASLTEMMDSHERALLEEFCRMYKTEGEIAQRLGTNQSTISRKLKKYGINKLKD